MKKTVKRALATMLALAVVATGFMTISTTASAAEVMGTAYIGIGNTDSWGYNIYRGEGGENTYEGTDIDGDGRYTCIVEASVVGTFDYSSNGEPTLFYIDIKGLGTYLELEDASADDCAVTVSDVVIKVDGSLISVDQDAVYLTGGVSGDEGSIRINFINPWKDDALYDAVLGTKVQFTDYLSVTFTISGLGEEGTLCNATDADEVADTVEEEVVEEDATEEVTEVAETTETAEATTSSSSTTIIIIVVAAVVVAAVVCGVVFAKKKK